MERKRVKKILKRLGVDNKFTLRTVSFSDLARDEAKVLTIKQWAYNIDRMKEIKGVFGKLWVEGEGRVIVEFDVDQSTVPKGMYMLG